MDIFGLQYNYIIIHTWQSTIYSMLSNLQEPPAVNQNNYILALVKSITILTKEIAMNNSESLHELSFLRYEP